MKVSGKLVIITVLAIALAAAGASWWFRYNATRHAAGFWGGKIARLIRDAPHITLEQITRNNEGLITTSVTRDVSRSPGITHLRAALLEDKSFNWPASEKAPSTPSGWLLKFSGDSPDEVARLWFTPDLNYTFHVVSQRKCRTVSCAPISAGLREMFTEMMTEPASQNRTTANEAPSKQ